MSDKHWWGSVVQTGCAQLDRMFSREVTGQGMGMRMEARVNWHEREDKRNFREFRQVRWEEKNKDEDWWHGENRAGNDLGVSCSQLKIWEDG